MNTLSVAIITQNEADHIEACIRSVQWADDIVVVDCFSRDATVEIASGLGVRVFQEPWKGYARQKNSAIEKATGNWILSLDADERVTGSLRGEIERLLRESHDTKGYFIPRKNFFCGRWIRHGGWYPDYNLRLFRKGAGSFQERAVHERLAVEGAVGRLRNPLAHYTYDSVADYLARMERYSRLAALEITGKGSGSRWHTLTLRPFFTFFQMYLLRAGFLDGQEGFFLAVSYAYYTFLKYYRYYRKEFIPAPVERVEEGN